MSQSSVIGAPPSTVAVVSDRNVVSTWARCLKTWLVRRQGWQDMNTLDDHLLKDVGFLRERGCSENEVFFRAIPRD